MLPCSLLEGTLLPTNYELVQETETVILARGGQPLQRTGDLADIDFTVLDVLRGAYPEKTIRLKGGVPFAGASPEDDFSRARPGAFVGSCTAFDYRPDHLYVLFLERADGSWRQHLRAFSRVNEEVASASSPWVQAVRAYSRVADLGDYERSKAALQALARTGDRALKADIERHFKSATGAKSETDLLALYAAAADDSTHGRALWALAGHTDGKSTAELFHQLLAAPELPSWAQAPACAWASGSKSAGELPNLLRHAAKQPAGRHWPFLEPIATLATADDFEALRPLLALLDEREAEAFFDDAHALAVVPAAVTELRKRLHDDPRDQDTLVLVLARWGDPDILAWALRQGFASGERSWVARYVWAASPLTAARAQIDKAFRTADPEVVADIVDGLAHSARPDRLELVTEALARFPGQTKVEAAARRALLTLESSGEPGAKALLGTLSPAPDDD